MTNKLTIHSHGGRLRLEVNFVYKIEGPFEISTIRYACHGSDPQSRSLIMCLLHSKRGLGPSVGDKERTDHPLSLTKGARHKPGNRKGAGANPVLQNWLRPHIRRRGCIS